MQKKVIRKIDLSITQELRKIQQMADKLESQGKELASSQQKATNLLKQADSLLQPIGGFQESKIEEMLSDLKKAGLESSNEYRSLSNAADYLDRINTTVKRMSREVSKALN